MAGLYRGVGAAVPEDSEIARRYSRSMARCMAALSKLAYCNIPPSSDADALKETCSTPCSWAGIDLEPGSRLVAKSQTDDKELDFGFVAKFTRGEDINEESMAARGCIVVLRGPDNEDTALDITTVQAAESEDGSGSVLPPLVITERLDDVVKPVDIPTSAPKSGSDENQMEVWETDAFCAGCQVAASYKKAWDSLKQRLVDHLSDAGCKPMDAVYVTGHSKGAALATLAMFSLQAQMGYHVQLSYNFESPRVGNAAFANAFHQLFCASGGPLKPVALYRITHARDRAVREPTSENGFVHVGQQVWYPKDTTDAEFTVCGNETLDPHCGVGQMPRNLTCPLKPSTMCSDRPCAEVCKMDAPAGGPHCQHPLAPGRNFCAFGGNHTENWGSEWNEVVRSGKARLDWEKFCAWGKTVSPPKRPDVSVSGPASTSQPPVAGTTQQGPAATEPPKPAKHDVCFETNVTFQPLDMTGHYFSAESDALACQLRCAGIEGCQYFSFFPRGTNGDCHVTGAGAYRQKGSVGFIAGPRTCEDNEVQDLDLLGGFTNSGPTSGQWYIPGVVAICVVSTYFIVLAGLALSGQCRLFVHNELPSQNFIAASQPL